MRGINGLANSLSQRLCNDAYKGALPTLFAATQDVPGGSYVGPDGIGHLRGYPVIHKTSKRAMDDVTWRDGYGTSRPNSRIPGIIALVRSSIASQSH